MLHHCQRNISSVFFTITNVCLQRVKIRFDKFDLEKDSSCKWDFVKIRDGSTTKRYCGNKIPAVFVSSSNYAYVYFKTDRSETHGGFLAWYRAVDPPLCKFIDYGWLTTIHLTELRQNVLYNGTLV